MTRLGARIAFAGKTLLIAAALWAGLIPTAVTTPIALAVLPAGLLALAGIAAPAFILDRRWLRIYVNLSAAASAASVAFLLLTMAHNAH